MFIDIDACTCQRTLTSMCSACGPVASSPFSTILRSCAVHRLDVFPVASGVTADAPGTPGFEPVSAKVVGLSEGATAAGVGTSGSAVPRALDPGGRPRGRSRACLATPLGGSACVCMCMGSMPGAVCEPGGSCGPSTVIGTTGEGRSVCTVGPTGTGARATAGLGSAREAESFVVAGAALRLGRVRTAGSDTGALRVGDGSAAGTVGESGGAGMGAALVGIASIGEKDPRIGPALSIAGVDRGGWERARTEVGEAETATTGGLTKAAVAAAVCSSTSWCEFRSLMVFVKRLAAEERRSGTGARAGDECGWGGGSTAALGVDPLENIGAAEAARAPISSGSCAISVGSDFRGEEGTDFMVAGGLICATSAANASIMRASSPLAV
jgi:hypothetical protein